MGHANAYTDYESVSASVWPVRMIWQSHCLRGDYLISLRIWPQIVNCLCPRREAWIMRQMPSLLTVQTYYLR
jgi:hypothetical protein